MHERIRRPEGQPSAFYIGSNTSETYCQELVSEARRVETRHRAVGSRHQRHAGVARGGPGGELVAEGGDGLGARADELDSGVPARAREVGVLGEEAVAGMNGVGLDAHRGLDHAVAVEVALARGPRADGIGLVGHQHVKRDAVRLAEDGDRRQVQLAEGADDAHRDLAAVRDQDAAQPDHVSSRSPRTQSRARRRA